MPWLTLAPQVVGAGDRKKKIVGPVAVNVYAIGMYVDPVAAKAAGATVKADTSLRGGGRPRVADLLFSS